MTCFCLPCIFCVNGKGPGPKHAHEDGRASGGREGQAIAIRAVEGRFSFSCSLKLRGALRQLHVVADGKSAQQIVLCAIEKMLFWSFWFWLH